MTDAAKPATQPPTLRGILAAFAMVGVGGFGGALPVIMHELVDRRRWLTRDEFAEILSLCQVLPGANVVNVAIVFGMRSAGWRGAVAGLVGMLALPVCIVLVLVGLYSEFSDLPAVQRATGAVAAAAAGLVCAVAVRLLWPFLRRPLRLAIALVAVALIVAFRVPLVLVIAMAAPLGLALVTWELRRGG